jgi:hypothetical protein
MEEEEEGLKAVDPNKACPDLSKAKKEWQVNSRARKAAAKAEKAAKGAKGHSGQKGQSGQKSQPTLSQVLKVWKESPRKSLRKSPQKSRGKKQVKQNVYMYMDLSLSRLDPFQFIQIGSISIYDYFPWLITTFSCSLCWFGRSTTTRRRTVYSGATSWRSATGPSWRMLRESTS